MTRKITVNVKTLGPKWSSQKEYGHTVISQDCFGTIRLPRCRVSVVACPALKVISDY